MCKMSNYSRRTILQFVIMKDKKILVTAKFTIVEFMVISAPRDLRSRDNICSYGSVLSQDITYVIP